MSPPPPRKQRATAGNNVLFPRILLNGTGLDPLETMETIISIKTWSEDLIP